MRQVKNASFNKELLQRINNLRELVTKNITPENVKFFDADIIRTAKTFLDKTESYSWNDNVNVNSIEMSKVNQIIRYLKKSKLEIRTFTQTVIADDERNTPFEEDGKYYLDLRAKQIIPEQFDSSNSFVIPQLTVDKGTYSEDISLSDFLNNQFYDSDNKSSAGFTITRNKDDIEVKVSKKPDNTRTSYLISQGSATLKLKVVYILWRYL